MAISAVAPNRINPNARIITNSSYYVKPDERRSAPVSKHLLGDGHALHVAGTLIDPPNLGIPVQFFDRIILGEPDSAQNFHGSGRHSLAYLRCEILAHGCLHDKWQPSVAQSRSVIDHQAGRVDV